MVRVENENREERILDAAESLFVRFGYDKTTVNEIAREAGISKGAVYLHFDGKDALFEALLLREMKNFAETWYEGVQNDPRGGTIGGMYKNMLYAINANPFMRAIFKQDRAVFGNYLRKPDNMFKNQQPGGGREEFIRMMQDMGAVRKDLDPVTAAHIINMMAYGLVAMDEIMAPEDIPPVEDIIEGIADFMDRAMTPEDGGNSEAGKLLLEQVFTAGRQQYETMKTEIRSKNRD